MEKAATLKGKEEGGKLMKKILIIDDEPELRRLLNVRLRANRFQAKLRCNE